MLFLGFLQDVQKQKRMMWVLNPGHLGGLLLPSCLGIEVAKPH